MEQKSTTGTQTRSWPWLLFVIAGLIAMQFMSRSTEHRLAPGPARGDIALLRDVLPDAIGDWQCFDFQPGLAPEQLPDGQFWWTHSWRYQCQSMTAVVAFDQADWKSWHELTVCYQAIGWTPVHRDIRSGPLVEEELRGKQQMESDGQAWVLVSLEQPTNTHGTLVFSLFDQAGQIIPPPLSGIAAPAREQETRSSMRRVIDRLTYELPASARETNEAQTYDRILQCQVFVQHQETLSDEQIQQLTRLHLTTREMFQKAWLKSGHRN